MKNPPTVPYRCGSCCRPLGAIDLNVGDGRCYVCRLEVEPVDDVVVLAVHRTRGVIAVECMEDARLANKVAYAWRQSKMDGVIVEVIEPAAKAASLLAR